MLRSEDFFAAVRFGARSGSRRLVIHYSAGETGETTPALVGVVVPKKQISHAAHRNRIKRRVRAPSSGMISTDCSPAVVRPLVAIVKNWGVVAGEQERDHHDRCGQRDP